MLESVRRRATMATPWSEEQFTVVAEVLREVVHQDKLELCPQWRSLYDLARQKGLMSYAGRPEHFRFSGALPSLARILGLKSRDPQLLSEAQQLYEALIAGSPQRQLYHYRLAELFTETNRIEAAGDQLMQAFNADPEIGESTWRLGEFRWRYGNQAELASKMVVQSVNGACPRGLSSLGEAILLARAFLRQGDLEGLRSMELRIAQLPPQDQRSASLYLDIARLQEQAGLLAERDRMLGAAAARDATISARFAPLVDGRLQTIAEAEGVAALATRTP
jgi:tetratricopeptide (TPR) repeat protein